MIHDTRQSFAVVVASLLLFAPDLLASAAEPGVTLRDDGRQIVLSNGHVEARVDKAAGTFTIARGGRTVVTRGYWSHVGRVLNGRQTDRTGRGTAVVRRDPAKSGGNRAEVAVVIPYQADVPGALPCDVELRYALGRGDQGLYATAVWRHGERMPGFSIGEARLAMKLPGDVFDHLTIDANRNGLTPSGDDWDRATPLNLKEARRITTGPLAGKAEHKYGYSAVLADTPAYGWCSTRERLGVWLINPSKEFVAGGPTKVELTGHLDVNPGGQPTLLDMWHGSHYGGSVLSVADNEPWSKTIGPVFVYCNAGGAPDALWKDALTKARTEQDAWPYEWVHEPDYPNRAARGSATGTLTIDDKLAPAGAAAAPRNVHVGLAAAPYESGGRRRVVVDWQRDSKHYQFWTRADAHGRFSIGRVRPGTYTLYAFAEGVLGEYSRADVTITAGQSTNLGTLTWTPVRHGRQLWEIGTPDRTAAEFRHGEHYWRWGIYHEYPKDFPTDVNFTIGKSDPRTDWNYAQPGRIDGRRVSPTTWTITFDLPDAPAAGTAATLRLAICGSRGQHGLDVAVNGQPAGNSGRLPDTGVMHRDGIRGYWFERAVKFDGAMLQEGTNTLTLTHRPDSWVDGVLYDYVRLELDERAKR